MEKLIERFELICGIKGDSEKNYWYCAREAGKLAIEFARYIGEHKDVEYEDNEWTIFIESENDCFPFTRTTEELFNGFIKKYYARD